MPKEARSSEMRSILTDSETLIADEKALIITAIARNFVVGVPLDKTNFCDTCLCSILGFIGISDVKIVPVPDQFMSDEI